MTAASTKDARLAVAKLQAYWQQYRRHITERKLTLRFVKTLTLLLESIFLCHSPHPPRTYRLRRYGNAQ